MSLDNKVVDLADLKVSHDYLLEQDELLSDRINELGSVIDGVESTIGDLSNLSTTLKDDIVSAINEVLQTGGRVKSVNGNTGDVVLKTSDLTNDSGYLTIDTETDPTVPSWAKQANKPTYTAREVGAPSVEDMNSEVNTRLAADTQLQSQITALGNGSPVPVETVAEMTDNTKAYLYTGSEQGYISGYWYTYDSTQAKFVPRGEYGAGVVIDSTLTVSGNAADAKKTGERLEDLETVIVRFDDTVVSPDITFILGTDTYPIGWKTGSYASDTGIAGNSTRYIRTITGGGAELVAPDRTNKVYAKAPSGKYISIYEYSAEGVYIGRHGVPNNASGTGTNEVEADATQGHIYKLCVGFTETGVDASTWLTEEFVGQIQFSFTIRGGVEKIDVDFNNDSKDFSNYSILCAKERNYTDGTPTTIDWYLVCSTSGVVYMTKDFKTGKRLFVAEDPWLYKFGVMPNGDIIAVYRTEFHSVRTSEDYRKNPYVWLASEDWKTRHVVNFGSGLKPSGWLENCGFCPMPNGDAMFAEYTRPSVTTVNCWKISGDITNPASWIVVKSFEQSGSATEGLEHMHYVIYDFITGIYYLSTGDDDTGSQLWYSANNGATWSMARQPSEKYCRSLNLIFTKDYIYWASDSSASVNHYLFRCERDNNGVIDFATVTELTSLYVTGVATYGVSYLPELNAIVLLDYCDTANTEMPFRIYSIADDKLYTMNTLESADGTARHVGFRTEYTEWYPSGNYILCGFGKRLRLGDYKNYIKGLGNAGAYDGYAENVNNLRVGIYKTPTGYGCRFGTAFAYFNDPVGIDVPIDDKFEVINERLDELEQSGIETTEIYVDGTTLVINTNLVNGNEVSY